MNPSRKTSSPLYIGSLPLPNNHTLDCDCVPLKCLVVCLGDCCALENGYC